MESTTRKINRKHTCDSGHVYCDYIGFFRENIAPKDLLAVSNTKTKHRKLYTVNKCCVDLDKDGLINCPKPNLKSDDVCAQVTKYLMIHPVEVHTEYVERGKKKVKLTWEPCHIRGSYQHFGKSLYCYFTHVSHYGYSFIALLFQM